MSSLLQCYCSSKKSREVGRMKHSPKNQMADDPCVIQELHSYKALQQVRLEMYRPNPEDYQVSTTIGSGCNDYATVSAAKHKPSGTHVAIRRVPIEECNIDFSTLQREILVSKLFNHPYILPYYCTFVINRELWAVMPLMAYGSCKDLICHQQFMEGLPELAIAFILRDVLMALEYIHQRGCIHRSIRASHILIGATGHVALSGMRYLYDMMDEGSFSQRVHHYPDTAIQSLLWMAPEILEQNLSGYDTKSDIYSVGITACELANGTVPFGDMPLTQMLLEKVSGTTPRLLDRSTVPEYVMDDNAGADNKVTDSGIGDSDVAHQATGHTVQPYDRMFSHHFHDFVNLCLQSDPDNRPSATQLLSHPFFKQVRKKNTETFVPRLLQPVKPLTNIEQLPKDDSAVGSLAEKMREAEIDEGWDFDV